MMENAVTTLSDNEIVHAILAGDKNMFELLIRKYNSRMYRVGMSIVKDKDEVEDLMQNSYIKAYQNLAKFEMRASFGTWVIRIMVNECLAHQKKSRRKMETALDNVSVMENQTSIRRQGLKTPMQMVLNKELAAMLEDSLLALPEKYRVVFVMREVEGMSVNETIEALAITESNVKVRLNRAKTMLRKNLSGYYKNDLVFNFHLSRCDRIVAKVLAAI